MLEKQFPHHLLEENLYTKQEPYFAPQGEGQPYTIVMPPPNVTGTLHLGHALNGTIQDVLVRWKRMQGYKVLWQPGTDHAGIATQMVVEQQLHAQGLTRHDLGRSAFIDQVWKWKEQSGNIIVSQQRRLRLSPCWDRSRFTMDTGLSKAVVDVFVALHDKGLIYRDKRLVNWDIKLQTAISDLEVVNKEEQGSLWYIRYLLVEDETGAQDETRVINDCNQFTADNNANYNKDNAIPGITVATTRPETLFGDVAVAVHPDDERYQHLIGKMVRLPLTNRTIPIVADAYCDPKKGSGAVKITPAHDFNDFMVGKRHDLPLINVIDSAGYLIDVPTDFLGLTIENGRKKVLTALETQGLLEETKPHLMTKPYGDRSGVEVQPRLTDQWFVNAKALAEPAIEAVNTGAMTFFPKNWENTYFDWLNHIEPWCISRQIWWGHQIPAWYGPDGHIFVAQDETSAMEKARLHYGEDQPLQQDLDVLDTWFSSALWPFSTMDLPPDWLSQQTKNLSIHYPTDLLVTGFDIIFFWVARMMMIGINLTGQVPFKTVYIHSLVRDEKGQKMSKSKGNIIDPLVLLDEFGSDPVRFAFCALATPGRDIKLGRSVIENYRNFMTKIWNAARFLEMQEEKLGMQDDSDQKKQNNSPLPLHPLSQWILGRFDQAAHDIHHFLEECRLDLAAKALYHFLWDDLCDVFIEGSKPFYDDTTTPQGQSQAQGLFTIARETFIGFLHLAHPFMPMISDYLYQYFTKSTLTLTIAKWPATMPFTSIITGDDNSQPHFSRNTANATNVDHALSVVEQIRSVKGMLNIPLSTRLPLFIDSQAIKKLDLGSMVPFINHLARVVCAIVEGPTDSTSLGSFPKNNQGIQSISLHNSGYNYVLGLGDGRSLEDIEHVLTKKQDVLINIVGKLKSKIANQAYRDAKPDQWADDQQLVADKTKELEKIRLIAVQLRSN